MAARPEPAGDACEQIGEQVPRHVIEDVERRHGVERAGGELDLEQVGVKEPRLRDTYLRAPELLP